MLSLLLILYVFLINKILYLVVGIVIYCLYIMKENENENKKIYIIDVKRNLGYI